MGIPERWVPSPPLLTPKTGGGTPPVGTRLGVCRRGKREEFFFFWPTPYFGGGTKCNWGPRGKNCKSLKAQTRVLGKSRIFFSKWSFLCFGQRSPQIGGGTPPLLGGPPPGGGTPPKWGLLGVFGLFWPKMVILSIFCPFWGKMSQIWGMYP